MTGLRLILRSLWFYRRTNAGTLLGAALAAMILTGALGVGDAVRYSLQHLAETRLGRTEYVVVTHENFFRADLADRLSAVQSGGVAPVLLLDGVLTTPDEEQRVNAVQVVGVDDRFWAMSPAGSAPPPLAPGTCRVNQVLAEQLGLSGKQQERVVLRLRKQDGLPADMTLAARGNDTWSRLLTVTGVQEPADFGFFTLRATQRLPPTIFVSLEWLSEQLGVEGRANTLLIGQAEQTISSLQQNLNQIWHLEDAGLQLETTADGTVELTSARVFIPPDIAAAAMDAFTDARPVSTYFLNRIEAGERSTPYSFASAPGAPRVPDDLDDDAVRINDWLAEDLGIGRGDTIRIYYYAVDAGGQLQEQAASLRVAGILPVADVALQDRGLVPDIPGLSDAANCRDWDPGIDIELARIRDKDEAYWEAYGPLPKVYLTLATAERLWSNRFGVYTALRFEGRTLAEVQEGLRAHLDARMLGLVPQAIREAGLAASRDAVDFGQLFIGLSFFLIVAAILLTLLLFGFGITQRMEEAGTLLAMGFPAARVRRQLQAEGLILAVTGAVIGGIAAQGYHRLMLWGLRTIWYDAVHTTIFVPHLRAVSAFTGIGITCIAAALGMAWVLRRHGHYTIHALQRGLTDQECRTSRCGRCISGTAGMVALLAAGLLVVFSPLGQGPASASAFFGSGSLLLAGMLLLAHSGMAQLQQVSREGTLSRSGLILRTLALRRGRSLACLALMALGVFLVMAVAANRKGAPGNPADRSSGTGGWLLWGQTTLPVTHDLNSKKGRMQYGLQDPVFEKAGFTQVRFREGDDASCLNLNLVSAPHILGIKPDEWQQRNPFLFAQLAEGVDPGQPWQALAEKSSPGMIHAFADMADIVWGLGLSVGDTLDYTDEQGQPFKVRLIGGLASSILQGHILMAEEHFTARFPSQGGHHVLLVDAPEDASGLLSRLLTQRLADRGLACQPTAQRLAAFRRVENTYLSIFLLLGGFGCLIGSAGLGIVAARNILERRGELALLRAVGYRRRQLRRLLFLEHACLAIAGIAVGAIAAALAVAPALAAPGTGIPWGAVLSTLAVILLGSLLWIWVAIHLAMRGALIAALRSE